jgi:PleD family two-component response regulator
MPQTDEVAARSVLEKLCRGVMENLSYSDWAATMSTGAVAFHGPPPDVDEMLRIADDAMYDAKRRGKGTTLLRVYPGDGTPDVVLCLDPSDVARG